MNQPEPRPKINLRTLQLMKARGEPITFVTAYDYPLAQLAEAAGINMILVGDSGGMTVLGYETTTPVTMEEMIMLAKAARRGAPKTFIVGDMPLGSYQVSEAAAVTNALRFLKEAGSDAVKCEGGKRMGKKIRAMVDAGILVMGHLGLTPQNTAQFGGYRVQGKTRASLQEIIADAKHLEEAGVFAILLEAMPEVSAAAVRESVKVPVYGIGAGAKLDGQLLIMHDLVGLFSAFKPKFAKRYCEAGELIKSALTKYCTEVKNGVFPGQDFIYPITPAELLDIKPVVDRYLKKNRQRKSKK